MANETVDGGAATASSCGISEDVSGSATSTVRSFVQLHAEGPCEVLHISPDGREFLSAGGDGKLAAAKASVESTDIPARAWTHRVAAPKGALTAAAVSEDRNWLATGQENDSGFSVWVCRMDSKTLKPTEVPKLVSRFTLPVRHLAWHPTLPLLGMASDDGKLTIWDRKAAFGTDMGPKKPKIRFEFSIGSNAGGVRCLAFDPRGELLATVVTNGDLVVFGLQDCAERYRASVLPKVVIGKDHLRLAWRPDGEVLVLPGEPSIRLLKRADYAAAPMILEGGHRHPSTAAAWSASGEMLATASFEAVAIWRPPMLMAILSLNAESYSLLWGGDTFIALGTMAGSWTRLNAPSASDAPLGGTAASLEADAVAVVNSPGKKLPNSPAKTSTVAVLTSPVPVQPVTQIAFQPGATSQDARRSFLAWNEHGALKFAVTEGSGQEASSTSMNKKRRGAATAAVGRVVVEYSRERGRSAVRDFQAPAGLSLGALGPGVCALAANLPKHSSRITVHLATPWERAQFEHSFPHGETIEALAIGRNFVAAFVMPQRYLRIHTWSGLPLGILALGGDPVCLVACEGLLLCVTQEPGGTTRCEPKLDYVLYGIVGQERLASGRLPLTPHAVLRWVGFSAEALPLTLDSAGCLRALTLSGSVPMIGSASGDWLPVADLEDGGSRLWPVRAENGALHCAEVAKNGDEPRVGQTLKLRDVPYHLPLGSGAEQQERVLRQRFLSAHLNFAMAEGLLPAPTQKATRQVTGQRRGAQGVGSEKRMALKLFQTMAKSGEVEQAHDVARDYFASVSSTSAKNALLPDSHLIEEALEFAKSVNQEGLVEKISALLEAAQSRLSNLEATLQGGEGELDEAQNLNTPLPVRRLRDDSVATGEAPPTSRARVM